VEDFELLLPQVSPHFKGTTFRIYRDTRFAKDKTPYKTHTGSRMRRSGSRSGRQTPKPANTLRP
jgi:uncharacterized protein (DUF2461 family)